MKKLFYLFCLILLVSCGEKPRLNLYNWTYYIPDDVLFSFEKEFNTRVELASYDSNETMYAKIATGNTGFDITVPSGDYVSIMIKQGMLQPVNKELIPNFANLNEKMMALTDFDPGHVYSVPYFMGAAGVSVNTEMVKDYPESWAIFNKNDKETYRKMSMMNDMREVLGAALRYLGYSVNSTNPKELAQAKEVVLGWKKNLLKFDAESFGKDFASGNINVAHGYAEVVLKELEGSDNNNYKFFIPKEGSPMYMDSMVILKDSKHVTAAHSFINYVLRPEIHARIADDFFYPSLIPEAEQYRKIKPPYSIEELLAKGSEFKLDLGHDIALYNQIWNEILQSN